MSDEDLEIRRGGVVAVDTDSLRAVADRIGACVNQVAEAKRALTAGARLLEGLASPALAGAGAADVAREATSMSWWLEMNEASLAALGGHLRDAASRYEFAELTARWLVSDAQARGRIESRMRGIVGADTTLRALGQALLDRYAWQAAQEGELRRQAVGAGWLGGPVGAVGAYFAVARAQRFIQGLGRSVIREPLRGEVVPVEVARLRAGTTSAPGSLAAALRRVPGGDDGRVRIERYDLLDGSREFVVYIAGTQPGGGDDEAWDMRSNASLYVLGARSASFDATLAAMDDAGIAPGDAVHLVTHSQGAMVGLGVVWSDRFEVRTFVGAGMPARAELPAGTLSVELRHTDDPVASLSGPGSDIGTGSTGSFVAERVAHAEASLDDLSLPAHGLAGYVETARLVDASADPRVEGVRTLLDRLAASSASAVVLYEARRSDASASAASGGAEERRRPR